MDEEEFIKNFGMTREQYAQEFGSLQDPNLGKDATLRQKSVDKVAGTLQNLGFTEYSAYNQANRLLGNVDNPLTEGGIGVLDFTPVQIPFAIQEGKRALQEGDYFQGVLGLVGSGLEMLPAAKLFTTPVKNFFKNLGNKISTNETIDQSRRSAMTKIAAAPLAVGALSEVPVEKIVDDLDFIDEVDKLPIKPIEPKIAGSSLFKNMKQEAQFAADMYNAKTGKNLTSKQIVDKDMAEYLYWTEEGNYGLEEAARKLKSDLVYEVLDEVGYEVDNPKVMKVFQKYMGDADEYVYGSSGGDELAQKLFKQENPDKFSAEGVEYEDADIIDWIKSKGIHKTKYYKQLKRAGEETRSWVASLKN